MKKAIKALIISGIMSISFSMVALAEQSPRWEGAGEVWKVKNETGSGYLTNSWFQDLDSSWYMLGADGVMFSGLVTDNSTGKSYLLNTEHDGTFGRMISVDGVYSVNGKNISLSFNQAHDGTFGAIISGLSEARNSGVKETTLASIPTDSAGGSQINSSQSNNTSISSGLGPIFTDEPFGSGYDPNATYTAGERVSPESEQNFLRYWNGY